MEADLQKPILNEKIVQFILQIAAEFKNKIEIEIGSEKKFLQIKKEKNLVEIINFLENNLQLEKNAIEKFLKKNCANFAGNIIFDGEKLILRNENGKNFLIYDKNLILQQKINFENKNESPNFLMKRLQIENKIIWTEVEKNKILIRIFSGNDVPGKFPQQNLLADEKLQNIFSAEILRANNFEKILFFENENFSEIIFSEIVKKEIRENKNEIILNENFKLQKIADSENYKIEKIAN